ncbi:hypothetical protein TR51_01850 [Kitasatospora griseola]|uniref:Uncharacterized protein n=1 Tax=Kitasatospora griseola TaxID=2064 RepID=A0A0D0PV29_KITGR|nr:hypothetical protein TR51_01850 [Kitasatospora griseola]
MQFGRDGSGVLARVAPLVKAQEFGKQFGALAVAGAGDQGEMGRVSTFRTEVGRTRTPLSQVRAGSASGRQSSVQPVDQGQSTSLVT